MSTALKPGSRPRGPLPRSYARTVNFDWIEHVALTRWAQRHGLAVGGAIRELIRLGLILDAQSDPRTDSESLAALKLAELIAADYRTTNLDV